MVNDPPVGVGLFGGLKIQSTTWLANTGNGAAASWRMQRISGMGPGVREMDGSFFGKGILCSWLVVAVDVSSDICGFDLKL